MLITEKSLRCVYSTAAVISKNVQKGTSNLFIFFLICVIFIKMLFALVWWEIYGALSWITKIEAVQILNSKTSHFLSYLIKYLFA